MTDQTNAPHTPSDEALAAYPGDLPFPGIVDALRQAFDAGRETERPIARAAAFEIAARTAREVRQIEIDLAQRPFDELPEKNQYFAYGAIRAAENIELDAAAEAGKRGAGVSATASREIAAAETQGLANLILAAIPSVPGCCSGASWKSEGHDVNPPCATVKLARQIAASIETSDWLADQRYTAAVNAFDVGTYPVR